MKKIIGMLSSFGLITTAGVSVVACANDVYVDEFENDEDYYLPSVDEQPENLEDAIKNYEKWTDKADKYKYITSTELYAYTASIDNWESLDNDSKNEITTEYYFNSSANQKWRISYFWKDTYRYKISQFVENEKFEIKTPNGTENTLSIYSHESETRSYLSSFEYIKIDENKELTERTKEQINSIHEWGLLENTNILE